MDTADPGQSVYRWLQGAVQRRRVVKGYKKNAKRARTDVMGEGDARRR